MQAPPYPAPRFAPHLARAPPLPFAHPSLVPPALILPYLIGVGPVVLWAQQQPRQPKVCELEAAVRCNKEVVGLDIAVNDPLGVARLQRAQRTATVVVADTAVVVPASGAVTLLDVAELKIVISTQHY
eukprot:366486-Chlamydomonas_euryale.AAC.12